LGKESINPWADEITAMSYDTKYTFSQDIPMYIRYAESTGGPILDIGCGTGRVLIPMIKAGYQVTGIDNSSHMIRLLKSKLSQVRPSCRNLVNILEEDISNTKFPTGHKLAIITVNTFLMCLNTSGQTRTLRSIHAALVKGGYLVVDLTLPAREKTLKSVTNHAYPIITPDGIVQDGAIPYTSTKHLFHMFEDNGYTIKNIFSGYDLEPFVAAPGKLIIEAKSI